MKHAISTRAMTETERRKLERSQSGLIDRIVSPIIPLGLSIILWMCGSALPLVLLEKIGVDLPTIVRQWVFAGATMIGIIMGVYYAYSLFKFERSIRQRKQRALKSGTVEVISVESSRMVQQSEHNDEGPLYYFDIGDGKILFLCGQWIYDSSTYELETSLNQIEETETEDDWEPTFPCDSFTIHRIPYCDDVIKIEIRGQKLSPIKVIPTREIRLRNSRDSMIFEGQLEDLNSAMTKAQQSS